MVQEQNVIAVGVVRAQLPAPALAGACVRSSSRDAALKSFTKWPFFLANRSLTNTCSNTFTNRLPNQVVKSLLWGTRTLWLYHTYQGLDDLGRKTESMSIRAGEKATIAWGFEIGGDWVRLWWRRCPVFWTLRFIR